MSLVARHLEAEGLPTVILASARDITASAFPPRAVFLNYPLGNTAGRPFDPENQRAVVGAALDLLERVGMAAATPRVVEVALERGCALSETGRLTFPRGLVEDMLAHAAKSFTVHGRDPTFDFEARNGKISFCTGGATTGLGAVGRGAAGTARAGRSTDDAG